MMIWHSAEMALTVDLLDPQIWNTETKWDKVNNTHMCINIVSETFSGPY